MPVEFIGYIGTQHQSEIHPAQGPVIDRDYVDRVARAHDEGGFDRALVAFGSTSPESQLVVAHAASVTQRLGFMIAHRPGFTAPTVAARWRRWTSSPAAAWPCTSSPAARTTSWPRTATT
jgi:alkanesulfonate monooxygenase